MGLLDVRLAANTGGDAGSICMYIIIASAGIICIYILILYICIYITYTVYAYIYYMLIYKKIIGFETGQ
jgi:hypothetical protein